MFFAHPIKELFGTAISLDSVRTCRGFEEYHDETPALYGCTEKSDRVGHLPQLGASNALEPARKHRLAIAILPQPRRHP